MDEYDDADAWLAFLDVPETNTGLLSALFNSGDAPSDAPGPSLSPCRQKTKKTTNKKVTSTTAKNPTATAARRASKMPRAELQHLRLAVADLENVRTLLLQRQQRRIRKTSSRSATTSDADAASATVDRAWKAVASRQLQLLSAAKVENQQLRSTVAQQVRIVQHLTALVARAQRGLPKQPVARPLVPSDVVSQCVQQRTALFALVAEMRTAIDDVAADAALHHSLTDEFTALSISADMELQRVIPDGTVLGNTVTARVLPHARSVVADHLWQPAPTGRSAFITIDYNEQNDTTHVVHYTITMETPLGVVRLLGVHAEVRLREDARDVVLLASAMWPDAHTPRPINAVAYRTREWTIIEPEATRREGDGGSRVLIKCERSRFVHADGGTAALATDEAGALRHSVEQANVISMEDKHRRIDELLLGRASGVGSTSS